MKITLKTLLSILIFTNCVDNSLDLNENIEGEFLRNVNETLLYKNYPFTGKLTYYYEGGVKKLERNFKEGILHGDFISYYEDGSIFQKVSFYENQKNGLFEIFYENGKLKSKTEFDNGKQIGEDISFFQNGQLEKKSIFNNGNKEGEELEYFNDGKLKTKYNFNNGVKDGEYTEYNDRGQLISKGIFRKGNKHGKFFDFDFYKKVLTVSNFNNGIKEGEYLEYVNSPGINEPNKDYNISLKGNYLNGKKNGEFITYNKVKITSYRNESEVYIKSKTLYQNDLKNGKEYIYNEFGDVIGEYFYEKGKYVDFQYQYFPSYEVGYKFKCDERNLKYKKEGSSVVFGLGEDKFIKDKETWDSVPPWTDWYIRISNNELNISRRLVNGGNEKITFKKVKYLDVRIGYNPDTDEQIYPKNNNIDGELDRLYYESKSKN